MFRLLITLGTLLAGALAPAGGAFAATVLVSPGAALTPSGEAPLATSTPAPRPKPQGIGIRLVDAPVQSRRDPRAHMYIVDHLPPGMVIHRRVLISNFSDSSRHLAVYASGATVSNQGFRFMAGHSANELSTWTSTSVRQLDLAPHTSQMVTVRIGVPRDAAPGERYAVVWAETASPAAGKSGVLQVRRVGVRIYLSVGPGNPPPTDFTIDSLTAERTPTGRQVVYAQLHNTGGRALDLSGTLSLIEIDGVLTAGPFQVRNGTTLAPGDSGAVTVILTRAVPNGPWLARVKLRSGLVERVANSTITFPESTGTSGPFAVTAETARKIMILVAAGAFVSLVVFGFVRARKRRSRLP
ncbi:hypothetical protein Psi02_08940 [Planotetraspora silvatica]|uniref:Peptidase n=1 Tax=Planotetraspora silvatica TaxID=234614 RepID=A0A8J3UGY6_9ACTN|nr:peptidase [Planotetraspora silvatica]GII44470.1 hypothetical protein Psi02_08940 [Planotetraspora silvatica]